MRNDGIEPPTAGSGIQRSTTELIPLTTVRQIVRRQRADEKWYMNASKGAGAEGFGRVHSSRICGVLLLGERRRRASLGVPIREPCDGIVFFPSCRPCDGVARPAELVDAVVSDGFGATATFIGSPRYASMYVTEEGP